MRCCSTWSWRAAVLLWHIRGDSIQVKSVFLPRSELIKKVAELRNSLTDVHEPFNEQIAREMFLFLIQPVLQRDQNGPSCHYPPRRSLLRPVSGVPGPFGPHLSR